jgi:hypothetical protein
VRRSEIDLAHLETGDFDVEIETQQGKLFELLGQQAVVPRRDLGQSVVGNSEGSGLRRGEVIEAQRRRLGNLEEVACEPPTRAPQRGHLEELIEVDSMSS